MEIKELKGKCELAYQVYLPAIYKYRVVAEELRQRKAEYGKLRAEAYAKGLIVGKNETERGAVESQMFEAILTEIEMLTRQEAKALMEKEQAEIEVYFVRSMMRVFELLRDDDEQLA